ncbi:Dipeptidyl peptidase 4 [Ophidiomyces ophidiicola]|nr:Dipeptidyl peptidase 4 [Ophidiomyces ophidiicola]KAI1985655.1 Dipeptidyl peptidase 4 [Ophidiomyces ophidiicola]KAI1995071.1 Dipeptidyl peptidase 4 [Ophidiomyces ophidiicola]KAI1995259.1 Dipeptidyl peptidase 4 [Ophidiomyces ophidiicola]
MKLSSLLVFGGLCLAIDPPREPNPPRGGGNKLLAYNETVTGRAIAPRADTVNWIAGKEDGQYVIMDDSGALRIQSIVTNTSQVLVPADKVPQGNREFFIKPDLSAVLWATDYRKQYRHSFFANYHVMDIKTGSLAPLTPDQKADIQYAAWSPKGNVIAYVRGNNLFLWKDGKSSQITKDGGPDTFNGVPDWVYEEEIFGNHYALWFSPDGEQLAYMRTDETGVPTFRVPYYMNNQKFAPPYPRELELRYPKVSQTNPTVQFRVLEVASEKSTTVSLDAFKPDDLIIGEVSWLTEGHDKVAVRVFNRVQDREKVVLVDTSSAKGSVVRDRDGTDGWIDNGMAIRYVGKVKGSKSTSKETYYVDISDMDGWSHIYLFPVGNGKAVQLTRGNWEVVSISHVDTERQLVYFLSTKHHSTERHLYSVSYSTMRMEALVNDREAAYYGASFSPKGGYYILSYRGPNVPYQDLVAVEKNKVVRTLRSNNDVVEKLKEYKLPRIDYFDITLPSGEKLNVMQRLPANFSPTKKYPVLFTPYGGPGSQTVSKVFQAFNLNAYIASDPELEYITLTVDNRGTGFQGRAFRASVAKRLGSLEPEDQIFAAKAFSKFPYVDKERIGMWGWSYGGYLTSKTIEADSDAFSFGVITAPVSDWRFYDSMYTERYMKTYEQNQAGYNASAVRKPDGFKKIRGSFLIQHGTGDDNVHFQNAAALSDLLMGARVSPSKMDSTWFTDSDHGIRYNNNGLFQSRELLMKLYEEKNRKFGEEKHQWSKKSIEFAASHLGMIL